MRSLWLFLWVLSWAAPGCGKNAATPDTQDPCNTQGATLGTEVPYQRYQRPEGCLPELMTEYTQPNGGLGLKLFTIRSEESFQKRYHCADASGQPVPSGIDFSKYRLVLFY